MRLKTHQWVILGMGVAGIAIALYGKSIGWDNNEFMAAFYAGISMLWVPFINDRKCCGLKKKTATSLKPMNKK